MSAADEQRHLRYVRAAAAAVEVETARMGRERWLAAPRAQAATAFRLLTLGESSKHLSAELRGRHDLPWRAIVGLRNQLAHEHLDVDPAVVWDIATRRVPELGAMARHELAMAPRHERRPSFGRGLGIGPGG